LKTAVDAQVKKWIFRPNQSEQSACQILLIASFTLDWNENPDATPAPANGIKVWINSSTPVIYTTNYSKAAK